MDNFISEFTGLCLVPGFLLMVIITYLYIIFLIWFSIIKIPKTREKYYKNYINKINKWDGKDYYEHKRQDNRD